MRIKGLTRIFSGSRASYTPLRALLCPTRTPAQPQQPNFNVFTEAVCDVGATPTRIATSSPRTKISPPQNGGICAIRGATRRRHAERRLQMLQNPHHYRWRQAPSRMQGPSLAQSWPDGVPINAGESS